MSSTSRGFQYQAYIPRLYSQRYYSFYGGARIQIFSILRFLPLLGARQNTHCPWWAALDSNQAKLNYQFYRLARYLLRYTDPYYLTFGGSSWTQTRTSIRRRIYRNLLINQQSKSLSSLVKEIGFPRPLCLSIPPMTHIWQTKSISRFFKLKLI